MLLVLALTVQPVPAHAGFLSFLGSLFSSGDAEMASYENSQNMALLQAALNYDPNPSKGGGDITVVGGSALLPDSGPLGTIADVPETPHSTQISVYVVREGDSLSQIAKMFNVSVNTILWSNDIPSGNLIRPGQTLTILPVTGIQHTVEKGETLKSIAAKYRGDVDEILQFNGLAEASQLAVGATIIIPDGELGTPKYAQSYSTPARNVGGPRYAGYYMLPVSGARRTQGVHGYNGVDLAAPHGREVVAAASGSVIIARDAGWNGGYGKYIVISHPNGTQTLYAHLNGAIVYQGANVVQGQVVGYVGSTGRSTGPHLHFEVRGAENPFARGPI